MNTLSWMLAMALLVSWLAMGAAFVVLGLRYRSRLGRSARRCRTLLRELDTTTSYLTQSRRQNIVLREQIDSLIRRPMMARRTPPAPAPAPATPTDMLLSAPQRASPAATPAPPAAARRKPPAPANLPIVTAGVEVATVSWRAFAETQVDESWPEPARPSQGP